MILRYYCAIVYTKLFHVVRTAYKGWIGLEVLFGPSPVKGAPVGRAFPAAVISFMVRDLRLRGFDILIRTWITWRPSLWGRW